MINTERIKLKEKDLQGHNIVIFSSSVPGTIGGIQSCNQSIIEAAISRGSSVTWAYPKTDRTILENQGWVNEWGSNVNFVPLEPIGPSEEEQNIVSDKAVRMWLEILSKNHNTEFLINMPSTFGAQLALNIPEKLMGQVTLWFHGMIDLSPQAISSLDSKLQHLYYKKEDTREKWRRSFKKLNEKGMRFVLVSERVRQSFIRNGILKEVDLVDVISPPTNMCHSCERSSQVKSKEIRGDFEFVSLTTMRLEPRKGIENLFMLAKHLDNLLTQRGRIKFIIVGADQNTPYTDQVLSQINDTNHKLANVYIEVVGPKNGHELCDFYNASDIFTMPSVTESFGLVIVEAAAHQLPVISWGEEDTLNSVPQLEELGFSIPCEPLNIHKHDDIGARFILDLMNNPSRRIELGKLSKSIALKTHNNDQLVKKILSIITNSHG